MFVTGVVWTTRYSAQSAEATGDGRFTVPVMAVQLNLSQKEKWDPANRRNIYRALLDMTEQGMLDLQNCALEQAVKDGAEASLDMPAWVIWPESSFPISTFYRDATGERFSNQDNVNFLSAEEDYVQALRNGICNFILLTGTDDIYLSDEGRVARAYNCLTVFEGIIPQPGRTPRPCWFPSANTSLCGKHSHFWKKPSRLPPEPPWD